MDSLALFLKVNYGVSMIAVNHLNESTFFETNQRFFNTHIKSKDTLEASIRLTSSVLSKGEIFLLELHLNAKQDVAAVV